MKGGFGCSPCCVPPCEECTRTCTEPHTGTAFETVYTLYFEGAEAGNPSDDYLEATGDVDTSDPYDGMDGTGPWSQTVSGTFTLTKTTTRYPCVVTVSFWRSNFVLGANTTPPPATTLTEERITVTNSVLSEGAIYAGGFLLQPGESHQFDTTIPLVAGSGDQSSSDPRSFLGVMRVSAACANDYVSFTVSGHIEWNVQKRQHVLYGLVRECYQDPELPDPCATFCDGDPPPANLYLTISGLSTVGGGSLPVVDVSSLNGTYVLDPYLREYGICDAYRGLHYAPCNVAGFELGGDNGMQSLANIPNTFFATTTFLSLSGSKDFGDKCYPFFLGMNMSLVAGSICASQSGTGGFLMSDFSSRDNFWSEPDAFSWTLSP